MTLGIKLRAPSQLFPLLFLLFFFILTLSRFPKLMILGIQRGWPALHNAVSSSFHCPTGPWGAQFLIYHCFHCALCTQGHEEDFVVKGCG